MKLEVGATQILWDVLFHMVQTFKTFEVPYYFEPESGSKREVPFEVPYYFEPQSGSKREVLFEVPYQFEPPGSEREVLLRSLISLNLQALKGKYCTFRTTYSFSITLLAHSSY